MQVIKRDGQIVEFNKDKISNAIAKSMLEIDVELLNHVETLSDLIVNKLQSKEQWSVEEIQDIVEDTLMTADMKHVAKAYILYRNKRTEERNRGWVMTDLQSSIWEKKYEFEDEGFESWYDRVSGGNKQIKNRIRKKQFTFAGRIYSNRGLHKRGYKVTYSNCYVLTPPQDNIESIFETAKGMARTYSYGGGCGTSISKLRPRDSKVHNNAKVTSGAVSFMPIYSLVTETIGQDGRRGALMLSIRSSHPDLPEFIDVKAKQGAITGANISIEIDNAFMIAVEKEQPYLLHFTVEDTGEVIERWVNAKELYEKIIKNNLDWAEPGMLFWDRISNWHFMSNAKWFSYAGTNPCGEEPLPAGGSCLLGSVNLSEFAVAPFTKHARFDVPKFVECVHDAVIALNEVLDEGLPLHPLEEQRRTVEELRQIGLGVMGIADMLIKLGITYGSTKSLALCEMLAHIMLNEAVRTSALIAKEKGTFSKYNYDEISDSLFFQENIMPDVKELVKEHGMRNSQLLCIAPTGSVATMYGVSGGIEPLFALEYERITKSLHGEDVKYWVEEAIVKEYRTATGHTGKLPEYFVTAHDIHWKNRIEMQAVWQRFIDASISSTINLPKEATVEETMELYLYAWKMGLKGTTIYREGCKRGGILSTESTEERTEEEPQRATGYYSTCPECKSEKMMVSNGCVTCQDCGFSPCS